MDVHRRGDMLKATVIVFFLVVICGYVIGLKLESFMGYTYTTGEWSPLWGAVGAAIPLLGARRIYRWIRARRAKRFWSG
jgi:hypothetical protein